MGPSFVWASPESVAQSAIAGAEKGKRVVIPGVALRAASVAAHHAPRAVLLRTLGPIWRRSIGE
jgi:short-subunit dehydrogenase